MGFWQKLKIKKRIKKAVVIVSLLSALAGGCSNKQLEEAATRANLSKETIQQIENLPADARKAEIERINTYIEVMERMKNPETITKQEANELWMKTSGIIAIWSMDKARYGEESIKMYKELVKLHLELNKIEQQ